MRIALKEHHLVILSAWLTNVSAGWFITLFATTNPLVLTISIIMTILSLFVAFEIERIHLRYD